MVIGLRSVTCRCAKKTALESHAPDPLGWTPWAPEPHAKRLNVIIFLFLSFFICAETYKNSQKFTKNSVSWIVTWKIFTTANSVNYPWPYKSIEYILFLKIINGNNFIKYINFWCTKCWTISYGPGWPCSNAGLVIAW